MAGHTIYHCIKNLKNACDEYEGCKFIVIETSTLLLDEETMNSVIDGDYPSIKSYDKGIVYKFAGSKDIV